MSEIRKRRGLACALYIARHYGVDAGWSVCGQTEAHNAHGKRINSSASGLFKQEFGGNQSVSSRSHVAASLSSKVTVVAKRLLISAPEVSHHPPLLLLLPRCCCCCRCSVSACDNFSFRPSPQEPRSHGSALPQQPCNFHHQ